MKNNQELVVLPEIDYKITTESAQVVAKEYIEVPEFDPALGVKDETNAMIIKGSKFLNKEVALVEKLRKSFKEPALTFGRAVDDKAKELKAILEPAKLRYADARHSIDKYAQEQEQKKIDAERLRVEILDTKIRTLQDIPGSAIGGTSEEITKVLKELEKPTTEEYQEKFEIAHFLHAEAIEKLEGMAEQAEKAEQADVIAKEAEKKRKEEQQEAADKLAAERLILMQEREEFEAEKRAAKEAEDMKEAERQAQQYAEEQELERAREAEEKESDRVENEERLKEMEAETLKTMTDIYDWSQDNTPEDSLKDILAAIIMDEVPNVRWVV